MLLAMIPIGLGLMMRSEVTTALGFLVTVVAMLPLIYYGFHNNFKRIRDIRGTTKDEVIVIIGIHIAFTIPVLGTIVSFIVLLMPGKITDNGPGLDKIKDVFTPAPSKPNENDQIMNIEKLHKLKEAGAITEEEFVKYKNEALRKIAG